VGSELIFGGGLSVAYDSKGLVVLGYTLIVQNQCCLPAWSSLTLNLSDVPGATLVWWGARGTAQSSAKAVKEVPENSELDYEVV
jgi:hypothetical protein